MSRKKDERLKWVKYIGLKLRKHAHPQSLINVFAVLFLVSIRLHLLHANFNILASLYCGADWFDSYLVEKPEGRFSGVNVYII